MVAELDVGPEFFSYSAVLSYISMTEDLMNIIICLLINPIIR